MTPDDPSGSNDPLAKIRKVSFVFRILCAVWLVVVILLGMNLVWFGVKGFTAGEGSAGTDSTSGYPAEVYVQNDAGRFEPGLGIQEVKVGKVTTFSVGGPQFFVGVPGNWKAELLSSFLSLAFVAVGLMILYRLFRLYERGEIFGAVTVRCYRWIAIWLLSGWAVSNLLQLFKGVAAGQPIQMHFSLDEMFFGGVLLWLVSWIMDEGRKVQEEQALTV